MKTASLGGAASKSCGLCRLTMPIFCKANSTPGYKIATAQTKNCEKFGPKALKSSAKIYLSTAISRQSKRLQVFRITGISNNIQAARHHCHAHAIRTRTHYELILKRPMIQNGICSLTRAASLSRQANTTQLLLTPPLRSCAV